jgi:hypothetical protein
MLLLFALDIWVSAQKLRKSLFLLSSQMLLIAPIISFFVDCILLKIVDYITKSRSEFFVLSLD